MTTRDDFDDLAERARMIARARPSRTYPPARLGDLTEARYRRHVTERAAALGMAERDLSAVLELAAIEDEIKRLEVG